MKCTDDCRAGMSGRGYRTVDTAAWLRSNNNNKCYCQQKLFAVRLLSKTNTFEQSEDDILSAVLCRKVENLNLYVPRL